MYLITTKTGQDMRESALTPAPFGAGFAPVQVAKAVKMEVHGSNITDPGPDFCLFKLIGTEGEVVAEKRVAGY